MLTTLQAYRAVAAIMVVLYHTDAFLWRSAGAFHYNLEPLFDFFDSGVQLFFVLSGFIILRAHQGDLGRREGAAPFYKKRILRIYPPYVAVTLALAGLYALFPALGVNAELGVGAIATSLLLIPSTLPPILAPAWTLKHEVFFYLVFSLLIWNRRWGWAAFFVWQAGCLVNLAAGEQSFPLSFFFSPNNLLFLFGMGAAALVGRGAIRRPAAWLALALGLTLLLATGLHRSYSAAALSPAAYVVRYGFAGAMIVAGLAELERSCRLPAPRIPCALGDASYAIYLVHGPVLSLGVTAFIATGAAGALPPAASFAALAGIAIGAGAAFHAAIEKPLTRALRARFGGPAPAPFASLASRLTATPAGAAAASSPRPPGPVSELTERLK